MASAVSVARAVTGAIRAMTVMMAGQGPQELQVQLGPAESRVSPEQPDVQVSRVPRVLLEPPGPRVPRVPQARLDRRVKPEPQVPRVPRERMEQDPRFSCGVLESSR